MTKIDCKYILDQMHQRVENKIEVPPSWWVDASSKLMVLIGDEHDKLYELESTVAKMRSEIITTGSTAAAAKAHVEATDEYKQMRKQKAYIEQITEFVRLAKIRAKLKDDEYRQN